MVLHREISPLQSQNCATYPPQMGHSLALQYLREIDPWSPPQRLLAQCAYSVQPAIPATQSTLDSRPQNLPPRHFVQSQGSRAARSCRACKPASRRRPNSLRARCLPPLRQCGHERGLTRLLPCGWAAGVAAVAPQLNLQMVKKESNHRRPMRYELSPFAGVHAVSKNRGAHPPA